MAHNGPMVIGYPLFDHQKHCQLERHLCITCMLKDMVKILHEDTASTQVELKEYFNAFLLLFFQNSSTEFEGIHQFMRLLRYYSDPRITLTLESSSEALFDLRKKGIDLLNTNLERITFCSECKNTVDESVYQELILQPRLEEISKKKNKLIPKQHHMSNVLIKALSTRTLSKKKICQHCKKDTRRIKFYQLLFFPHILQISIDHSLSQRSRLKFSQNLRRNLISIGNYLKKQVI